MAEAATKGIVREKENYSTGIGGFYRVIRNGLTGLG
jgi:hypothetical protein